MVELRMKAVRIGNSVRVALPAEILAASGIKAGDLLLLDYDKASQTITVKKS